MKTTPYLHIVNISLPVITLCASEYNPDRIR